MYQQLSPLYRARWSKKSGFTVSLLRLIYLIILILINFYLTNHLLKTLVAFFAGKIWAILAHFTNLKSCP